MEKSTINVPAMYADHHVLEVRRLLLEMAGVQEVNASSCFQVVEVSYDPTKINAAEIMAKIELAGYVKEPIVPTNSNNNKKIFDRGNELASQGEQKTADALITLQPQQVIQAVIAGSSILAKQSRDLAYMLKAVAQGQGEGNILQDIMKLQAVATQYNILIDGRTPVEIANDLADWYIAQLGQPAGGLALTSRAPQKRQKLWQEQAIMPHGVEGEVSAMSRLAQNDTESVENLLKQAICTGLSSGWGSCLIATEIADILLGTPIPTLEQVNWQASHEIVTGFSQEYLNYMLGGTYRASFVPLLEAVVSGRIRGVVAIVGNSLATRPDYLPTIIIPELLRQDVLILETGYGANPEFLLGEAGLDKVGAGLREICETIGIPPVLHLGSYLDNGRIFTTLSQLVEQGGLGDIEILPVVGLTAGVPSEQAVTLGAGYVGSGVYVICGGIALDNDTVTRYMSEDWEKLYGGKMEFVADSAEMVRRTLAHIDKKRAALKLPEYDANRFGRSGDARMGEVEAESLSLSERQAALYGKNG